jgi:predicted DNA-binding transcriptional regulator AlpA
MSKPPAFPSDFVSASTLAHRLDCSKTTINSYVQRGLLPKPTRIGELVRWRWVDVETFLANGAESHADANDPYLTGIERGATKEASH